MAQGSPPRFSLQCSGPDEARAAREAAGLGEAVLGALPAPLCDVPLQAVSLWNVVYTAEFVRAVAEADPEALQLARRHLRVPLTLEAERTYRDRAARDAFVRETLHGELPKLWHEAALRYARAAAVDPKQLMAVRAEWFYEEWKEAVRDADLWRGGNEPDRDEFLAKHKAEAARAQAFLALSLPEAGLRVDEERERLIER